MPEKCWNTGSCEHCGCGTPSLQMANIQCEGKEYPVMMNRRDWENYKDEGLFSVISTSPGEYYYFGPGEDYSEITRARHYF